MMNKRQPAFNSSFIIPRVIFTGTGIFLRRVVNGRTGKVRALRREARGAPVPALPERNREAHRGGNLRAVLERVAPAPANDYQSLWPRPDERGRSNLSLRQHESLL